MSAIKKNPIFFTLIIVASVLSMSGLYFAYDASGQLAEAQKNARETGSRLKSLQQFSPAPSIDNIQIAKRNVEELDYALREIRKDLQRGSKMSLSSDGVSVMAGIQQFISESRERAISRERFDSVEQDTVLKPIVIAEDFAFGFEDYAQEATMPDSASAILLLDKQRQILEYVINLLLAANPHSIDSVEREHIEALTINKNQSGLYRIDPAVSARLPGAIDTVALRITFSGYSRSLRRFLNSLASFDLPIVVRSLSVTRPEAPLRTKAAKKDSIEEIFGNFGDVSLASLEPENITTPVISENISRFTLDLEFIEIVLDDKLNISGIGDPNAP
ncbi:MAG: Amuc_1100 family pilus-like protein [Verrucomicrobiota bacterium]|nr:Amuc_1100 family pilus-like protein [Verrucomicrobiota bacterium]MEC8650533.1 Amuc_1100 family pilus-like protein [Verrucomicrobiota bacterium]